MGEGGADASKEVQDTVPGIGKGVNHILPQLLPASTEPPENDIHQVAYDVEHILDCGDDTIPQGGEDASDSLPEGVPVPSKQALERVEDTSDDSEHSL